MTVKELSQLYWLKKEITRDEQRLAELRSRATSPRSPNDIADAVQGGKNGSKVESLSIEIVDLEAIIAAKQIQCIHERNRLERYIAGIDDSLTRQIFTARFVELRSWEGTADTLGGMNSGESVRKIVYRYLQKHPD